MKKILLIASVLFIVIINTGCSKKKGCTDPVSLAYDADAEKDDGSCTYGGLGGNVTLVVSPEHHGLPIISTSTYPDTAFIKYNAINSPGDSPSAYDLIVVGDSGEDHVHIENLLPGKYIVFMTGWDTTNTGFRVRGGLGIEITQSTGTLEKVIPVSED